uniref:diphosphoinositol-polyphosphate diphosphatase n=1 Tax=Equus caballus TaxID=9796 RepID=A0A9L0RDM5_HORSE
AAPLLPSRRGCSQLSPRGVSLEPRSSPGGLHGERRTPRQRRRLLPGSRAPVTRARALPRVGAAAGSRTDRPRCSSPRRRLASLRPDSPSPPLSGGVAAAGPPRRRLEQQRQQEPASMMKFKPNQTRTYDREGFKKRAACLCFRSEQEDEVLLVSSSRYPDQWIVPGGGMEPEEEPGGAAVREVYEEAGVKGKLGRLLGIFEVSYKSNSQLAGNRIND